jgi:hypothetical protein
MKHASLVLLLGLAVGAAIAAPARAPAVDRAPLPSTQAQPQRDAIAATVIEAMRMRFGGRHVEFRFDRFDAREGSLRDLALSGAGRIRIEGGEAWLPIRYSALFDTATAEVVSPEVAFDTTAAGAAPPGVDAGALDAAVGGQLAREFAAQRIAFALGDLRLVAQDTRFVLVAGTGEAEFAGEGSAEVEVQGVYDRRAHAWLGVRYTLG